MKTKQFPFFVTLMDKMSEVTFYESKIELILIATPIMTRQEAFNLMRIIVMVVDEHAHDSIYRKNIAPVRVGLLLYKLIDEVTRTFGYSEPSANGLKQKVSETLISILDIYIDPKESHKLLCMPDYEGYDIFWYLDYFDMYDLLNCRILDRMI